MNCENNTSETLRGFGAEKNISSESEGIIYKLFSSIFYLMTNYIPAQDTK